MYIQPADKAREEALSSIKLQYKELIEKEQMNINNSIKLFSKELKFQVECQIYSNVKIHDSTRSQIIRLILSPFVANGYKVEILNVTSSVQDMSMINTKVRISW